MRLDTLDGCGLAIGGWPRFQYDASGGGGHAHCQAASAGASRLVFDPQTLRIPPLNRATTRLLGLPLPPGLTIEVLPERLEGEQAATGALQLLFQARFRFRAGSWYRAPDLLVNSLLSTGAVRSRRHRLHGQPPDATGEALLVGVAVVAPSGDAWLDRFLGLPDEALAVLRCRIS